MDSNPEGNASLESSFHDDLVNDQKLPSHLLNMSTGEDRDLVVETLEACLKLAFNQKTFAEVSVIRLQKELDDAKARIRKLVYAVRVRTSRAKQFEKSLSVAKTDQEALQNQLRLCQQQVKEAVEKNDKLQNFYTESLKVKNDKIKALEKDNQVLQRNQILPSFYSRLPLESSNISSEYSFDDIFVQPSSMVLPPCRVFTSRSATPVKSYDNFDWESYCRGLKIAQHGMNKMVENYDKLQESYTKSLREKNEKIKQMEEWHKTQRSKDGETRHGTKNVPKYRTHSRSNSYDFSELYTHWTTLPIPEVCNTILTVLCHVSISGVYIDL